MPASLPLFNARQHAKSQAEEEARRLRSELQAETKRREAAEQKLKEVEEVRAAAWRQTQAHQAEMAQRDAAHQAQLEAARQELQQARASASSAAPSSSQAPATSSAAASSADDEDAHLTRCEVGLRQHIELLREHERLQRKLADAQRKGKAKATGVFDTAGDLEIKVSRNVELRELCSSVSAYWATRGGRTLRRLWLLKRGNRNAEGDNFVVTYEGEDGYDDGGLTAEMFRTALEQAFASRQHFECPDGGTALPRAPPPDLRDNGELHYEQLALIGALCLKAMLDEMPIGPQLARFAYDFLVDEHRPVAHGALRDLPSAMAAMRDHDPSMASTFENAMKDREAWEGSVDAFEELLGSRAAAARGWDHREKVVLDMCKHVLFDKRAKALRAFRDGFVLSAGEGSDGGSLLDLSPQLANLSGAQLARLMGGDTFRSVDDFLKIVAFEQAPPADDPPLLRQEWHREAKRVFERFAFMVKNFWTPRQCADFLTWATGLRAVPRGADLSITIRLALTDTKGDPCTKKYLPWSSTCARTVWLPPYTTATQMIDQIAVAIAHQNDGFQIK